MGIYFVTVSYLEWKERTDLEPVSASDQLYFLPTNRPDVVKPPLAMFEYWGRNAKYPTLSAVIFTLSDCKTN